MDSAMSPSTARATDRQMPDEPRGLVRVIMMMSLILKRLKSGLHVEFTGMADRGNMSRKHIFRLLGSGLLARPKWSKRRRVVAYGTVPSWCTLKTSSATSHFSTGGSLEWIEALLVFITAATDNCINNEEVSFHAICRLAWVSSFRACRDARPAPRGCSHQDDTLSAALPQAS